MPTPAPSKPAAALPDGIEIFRAGRHTDDAGGIHEFSEADIAGMVASYDPALREAPLTVGHPASNLPAYGWVSGLKRTADGRLAMDTRAVEPQFAEMVRDQRFPKRSSSFYPPSHPNNPKPGGWYLRHVAFLGAQPPAIAGLKDIAFAEADNAGAVNFSEAPTPTTLKDTMDKEMQAQLDAANKKAADANAALLASQAATKQATDKLASFAEAARVQRTAGHVSFAEGEVKAGRLLPKDQGAAVAVLDLLADSQPVEFSEGGATHKVTPVEWLKGLIANAKPIVSFGEHAPGTGHQPGAGSAKGKTDAEIDTAARAYARQNKVSYAEGLSAVTSFTA